MLRTEKGFIEANGMVSELVADYTVITHAMYNDVLDDLEPQERLKVMIGCFAMALSTDKKKGEEEPVGDDLSDLLRKAMGKEFEE